MPETNVADENGICQFHHETYIGLTDYIHEKEALLALPPVQVKDG